MFNQIKVISLNIQLDVDPLSIYINISSSSFLTEVPEKPMTNSIREDKIVNKTDSNKICYQMLISLNCRWSHSGLPLLSVALPFIFGNQSYSPAVDGAVWCQSSQLYSAAVSGTIICNNLRLLPFLLSPARMTIK